jgi:hypothetical protein
MAGLQMTPYKKRWLRALAPGGFEAIVECMVGRRVIEAAHRLGIGSRGTGTGPGLAAACDGA